MITWLENPLNYSYLRETPYMSCSSKFPVKTIGNRLQDFSKILGYELIGKDGGKGVPVFQYLFYWLKEHDRDLMPDGVYKGPKEFGGKMPAEAKNPVDLVKNNPYVEVSHETTEP